MSKIISVIIPCYNVEEHIERVVASILIQTFEDFELLIINDGSTDNTANILLRIKELDPRIRVVNKVNQGVSMARNTGLDLATGKYVVFVDGDDWVDAKFLENYIMLLQNDGDALIYQSFVSVFSDKQIEEKLPKVIFEKDKLADALIILEQKRCLGGACNKIFSRDIIQQNNIRFDKRFSYGEDKIFTLEYLHYVNTIIFSDQCGYYYNRTTESSLSKKHHKASELLVFVEKEYELFLNLEKKIPNGRLLKIINARYSSFSKYVLLSMYRKNDHSKKEDKDLLRQRIAVFDKIYPRDNSFEIEVPKLINYIYKSDFVMNVIMKLKEKFEKFYIMLR